MTEDFRWKTPNYFKKPLPVGASFLLAFPFVSQERDGVQKRGRKKKGFVMQAGLKLCGIAHGQTLTKLWVNYNRLFWLGRE